MLQSILDALAALQQLLADIREKNISPADAAERYIEINRKIKYE